MKYRASLTLVILFCSIIFSCAKLGMPPGGPPDTTAPEIITSIPQINQRNVARDTKIRISFSEKMMKDNTQPNIFIVPEPEILPRIKWDNRDLLIMFEDSLLENQTYLITIKSDLTDLRRNKLERPYKLAFSTGEYLDQGVIRGKVYHDFKLAGNVDIWAFPYDTAYTIFDNKPLYLTQTSDSGDYNLEYLAYGTYICFAIKDLKSDRLFNPKSDLIGIPLGKVTLDSTQPEIENLNFNLSMQDTTSLQLLSANQTPDNLLLLKFSQALKVSEINTDQFEIVADTAGQDYNIVNIYSFADTTENIFLEIAPFLSTGNYSIVTKNIVALDESKFADNLDSVALIIVQQIDQTQPRIISTKPPDRKVDFAIDEKISFRFSEPILAGDNITDQITIMKTDSSYVEDLQTSIEGLDLICQLPEEFVAGEKYALEFDLTGITDIAGNAPLDSAYKISFTTENIQDYGAVSGSIMIADGIKVIQPNLFLKSVGGDNTILINYNDSLRFKQSVPSGSYFFYGFDDTNFNNKYDSGKLLPLEISEPFYLFPDTISVRSRFETEDIILKIK